MKIKNRFEKIFLKFKKLRYNVLIVPKEGSSGTRIYKLDFYKFVLFFLSFLVIAHFIFLALLVYTPIRNFLPGFNIITEKESIQLVELRSKLEKISYEFNIIRDRNLRLTYLMEGKPIPNNKNLLDSNFMKEKYSRDSAELFSRIPITDNILKAYMGFLAYLLNTDSIKTKPLLYFKMPVNGAITQEFNPKSGHYGIDFGLKGGMPVRASASGIVIFSDFTINDGHKVIISHGDGYITIYKHLKLLLKKEREKIYQGDVIGLSGNTGELTTNPHLHFEIWKNNIPINPKTICVDLNEN